MSFIVMTVASSYRSVEFLEVFDKIIYVAHFPLILIFFLKNFDKYKGLNTILSIYAISILFLGVITSDLYEESGDKIVERWSGFGLSVFITLIISILGFFFIKKFTIFNLFLNSSVVKKWFCLF